MSLALNFSHRNNANLQHTNPVKPLVKRSSILELEETRKKKKTIVSQPVESVNRDIIFYFFDSLEGFCLKIINNCSVI